jgi:glycosyltransferase involved in cell wall biosynthesis
VIASDVEQLAAVVERTSAGRVVPRSVDAWGSAVLDELPPPPPASGRTSEDVGRDHLAVYAQAASARTGQALRLLTYIDATEIGGAEHSLATLIRAFDPEIAVTVAGVDAQVVEWIAARRPGAATAVLRPVRGKFDVGRILEHVRQVRALRPQLLHAHLRHPWSCQYGILAGVVTPGVAVVAVELAIIGTASPVQRRLKRWTSARLDAHVACGERAARLVEQAASLPPGSIRTIYLGVEDAGAPPARAARVFRAGCLARLSREKCLDDAIRAVALLDDVELMLVGDGPERRPLEQLAGTLGVEGRVTFTGWRDDARSLLAELDAVLLPSRSEALPLVLVEAMLAELPVVATDVGSVGEAVVDGVTGLIVPVGSPQAIADAIAVLRHDPELRRRMGEEGRRLALERFDPVRSARAFTALYHEVLP